MLAALARAASPRAAAPSLPATTFVVSGRDGTLTVDATTGAVTERRIVAPFSIYAQITRIDVDEWRAWRAAHDPSRDPLETTDILNLGYWSAHGGYEPPAEKWRADTFAARCRYNGGASARA